MKNMQKKLIYIIVAAFIILGLLTGLKIYFSYYSIYKSAKMTLENRYIDIAEQMAKGLDKDIYEKFLQTKTVNENYKRSKLI